jgi:hypothetical protein
VAPDNCIATISTQNRSIYFAAELPNFTEDDNSINIPTFFHFSSVICDKRLTASFNEISMPLLFRPFRRSSAVYTSPVLLFASITLIA